MQVSSSLTAASFQTSMRQGTPDSQIIRKYFTLPSIMWEVKDQNDVSLSDFSATPEESVGVVSILIGSVLVKNELRKAKVFESLSGNPRLYLSEAGCSDLHGLAGRFPARTAPTLCTLKARMFPCFAHKCRGPPYILTVINNLMCCTAFLLFCCVSCVPSLVMYATLFPLFSCVPLCLLCSWCFHVFCCVSGVISVFMCFAVSPVFLVFCCVSCVPSLFLVFCCVSCVPSLVMYSTLFPVFSCVPLCLLCSWCFHVFRSISCAPSVFMCLLCS